LRGRALDAPPSSDRPLPHNPVGRGLWLLFALGCLLWTLWTLWAAPGFFGVDGWIYKGPGCALAQGHGLTARYLPASISDRPLLYAIYTPGLALAFALPAWLGGCTPRVDALFDLAIGIATMALLLPLALRPVRQPALRLPIVTALLLLVPTGLAGLDQDRGEPLALLCLIAALRCLAAAPPRRPLAYVLAGLAALSLPVAGPIGGLLLFATDRLLTDDSRRPRCFMAAVVAFGWFVLPLALWAGLWWLLDPQWHRRFLAHLAGPDAGPGIYWLAPDPLRFFLATLRETYLDNPAKALRSLFAVAPLAILAWAALGAGRAARRWLTVVLGLVLLLLLAMAYQPYYLFVTVGFASAIALALVVPRLRRHRPIAAALLILLPLLAELPGLAAQVASRSLERDSYEEMAKAAPAFVAAAAPSAPERMLMVPASHYLLFAGLTDALVVDHFWIPPLEQRLAGLAACAGNRLPEEAGRPAGPAAALPWEPWPGTAIDREPLTLLGLRLRNRLSNWSCDLFLRAGAPS
jgi:hypothetical protein